jgi:hypothetical protein
MSTAPGVAPAAPAAHSPIAVFGVLSCYRAGSGAEDAAKFTRWGPGASKLRSQSRRAASAALGQMCHDVVRHEPELAAALRAAGLLDCFVDEDSDEEEEEEEEEVGAAEGAQEQEEEGVQHVARQQLPEPPEQPAPPTAQ